MSLRRQRSHLAALIGACAVLLSACALPVAEPTSAGHIVTSPQAVPPPWQVIDGGLLGGNIVTGPIEERFIRPVAVAARGHYVYVVDDGQRRVYRYDTDLDRLEVIKELRDVTGGEVGDIDVMPDLSYYLADTDGGRVLHFDADGRLLHVYEDHVNIGRPVAVYVNEETHYAFIADGFNDDILVYNPAGELAGDIGIRGDLPGQFRGITGLARGPQGYYVTTRFGAQRVHVMGYDGRYLTSFQEDTVTFPTGIAVTASNRAFVADYLADDIKVYDDGRLVQTLGGHGSAPGQFKRIRDLWVDGDFLYVADSLNGRIQMLSLAALAPPPPAPGGPQ